MQQSHGLRIRRPFGTGSKGDIGIHKLASLIRTYFTYGRHHIRFNVCDAQTLRQAQER
ncbi:MAG: hypothetical protein KKC20_19235 [Proteobacteria bacterium]|nr:hypothetical protein [Pseudomonadota bacterium]